jgi:O-antigen/teichoic acid export membrane protein
MNMRSVLKVALFGDSKSSLTSRLAQGAFWSLIATVVYRGSTLVSSIAVARILGKEEFGKFGIIQSTAMMFLVFAGAGLGLTCTRFVSQFRAKAPQSAGGVIGLSLIVSFIGGLIAALGLFLFSAPISARLLAAPELSTLLRIASPGLLLAALNAAQVGSLVGFEAFRSLAVVNGVAGCLSLPIVVGGVYAYGLGGAVWGTVISLALLCVCSQIALWRQCRAAGIVIKLSQCRTQLNILWQFTVPAAMAASLVGPVNWICSAMLVNQPNGYAEMGVFNAANQWFGALLFLPAILGQAALPALSESFGDQNSLQVSKLLKFCVKANLIIIGPIVVLGSLASPAIMRLYGSGFVQSWPVLVVVFCTAGMVAIQTPIGDLIVASGQMWKGFLLNGIWAIVFILVTYETVHQGALGLANARLFAYVIHSVGTVWLAAYFLRSSTSKSTGLTRSNIVPEL